MDLFTYLMAKKGHNTHRDLFSYLLGKNPGGSGTYTTFSGTSLNISNTLKAAIKKFMLNSTELTQDGTPTLDTPQDIHVITGSNNIKITDGTEEQNCSIDLGYLEYCKIGDYADQIFKNTTDSEFYDSTLELNEWYLKKSIGKYIFTGNENLISYGTIGGYNIDNIISAYSIPNSSYPVGKCTISEMIRRISIYDGSLEGISYNNTQIFLRYANKTQEEILSLLANNELYYVLATPQYIHISQTDYPTLKTQLDNLYNNAKSYNGTTTITQTNDDLPFNISVDVKVANL